MRTRCFACVSKSNSVVHSRSPHRLRAYTEIYILALTEQTLISDEKEPGAYATVDIYLRFIPVPASVF